MGEGVVGDEKKRERGGGRGGGEYRVTKCTMTFCSLLNFNIQQLKVPLLPSKFRIFRYLGMLGILRYI